MLTTAILLPLCLFLSGPEEKLAPISFLVYLLAITFYERETDRPRGGPADWLDGTARGDYGAIKRGGKRRSGAGTKIAPLALCAQSNPLFASKSDFTTNLVRSIIQTR